MSKSIVHNVVKEKNIADLMKALFGMYEKLSMKKLFNLKMAENELVAQHLNEFNTITNQLSFVEIDFDLSRFEFLSFLLPLVLRFRAKLDLEVSPTSLL